MTDREGQRGQRGTYGSPPAGVLLAGAFAGGGLAQEVFVGPAAAQAPVAAGAAVWDRLGRQQQKDSGRAGARSPSLRGAATCPGALGEDQVGPGLDPGSGCSGLPGSTRGAGPGSQSPGDSTNRESAATGPGNKTRCLTVPTAPGTERQEATPRGANVLAGICLECCVPRDREGRPQFPLGPARRPVLQGCPRPLPPTGVTCGLAPGTWGLGWGAPFSHLPRAVVQTQMP